MPQTPLLGINFGGMYGGNQLAVNFDTEGMAYALANLTPWARDTWTRTSREALQILPGEDVGYVEYEPLPLPTLGEGLPDFWPRWSLPDKPAITPVPFVPVLVDQDTPEFPEGSIFAPGEVWSAPIPEEIYNAPYEVIDPAQPVPNIEEATPQGDEDVAIAWGDFLTNVAQTYISTSLAPQSFVGGAPATGAATPGPQPMQNLGGSCPPRKTRTLTIDCATGQEVKRTRRRRRRLLTESDFNDLMRIATLPNKQNVAVALSKAVGR